MSIFDTKTNPAICVLPWVHEYKTMDSSVGPCCHGDKLENDETIESIRQDMLKGIHPKACAKCYVKEAESGWSPRIHETIDWIKKFGEPDTLHPILEWADVRYDPTCNLKCKTCGPYASTLWQKEKKVFMPISESNKIYLENVSKKDLKKIYLAGG